MISYGIMSSRNSYGSLTLAALAPAGVNTGTALFAIVASEKPLEMAQTPGRSPSGQQGEQSYATARGPIRRTSSAASSGVAKES